MSNVEERYSRAIQSSHLEVTEFVGDVDQLVAAGWIRDGLATNLYRLRVEFDRCDKKALGSAANSLTDRVLVLASLKSLRAARDALGEYAMDTATRLGYEGTDVMAVTGNVLDIWLDPNCHHCSGRGFNGGYGKPQVWCAGHGRCNRTGKRRPIGGLLSDVLMADIMRKTANVNDMLKRFNRATMAARRVPLPTGFTMCRPRLVANQVVNEFSADGVTWMRIDKQPSIAADFDD